MLDGTSQIRMMEKSAKNISNNNEKVRGERVSLTKTVPTVNPPFRDAVKENDRFAGAK